MPARSRLAKRASRAAGKHVTIVALQLMMHRALEAAATLAAEGIDVEVIDLRSVAPLDKAHDAGFARKDRPAGVVEESPAGAGWGGDIASRWRPTKAFTFWTRRSNASTWAAALTPYSPPLEDAAIPNAARIVAAVEDVMRGYRR